MQAVTYHLQVYSENARNIIQTCIALLSESLCQAGSDEHVVCFSMSDFAVSSLFKMVAKTAIDNEVVLFDTSATCMLGPFPLEIVKRGLVKLLEKLKSILSKDFNGSAILYPRYSGYNDKSIEDYVDSNFGMCEYLFETSNVEDIKPLTVEDISQVISDLKKPSHIGQETDPFIIQKKRILAQEVMKKLLEWFYGAELHKCFDISVFSRIIFSDCEGWRKKNLGYVRDYYGRNHKFYQFLLSSDFDRIAKAGHEIDADKSLRMPSCDVFANGSWFYSFNSGNDLGFL